MIILSVEKGRETLKYYKNVVWMRLLKIVANNFPKFIKVVTNNLPKFIKSLLMMEALNKTNFYPVEFILLPNRDIRDLHPSFLSLSTFLSLIHI